MLYFESFSDLDHWKSDSDFDPMHHEMLQWSTHADPTPDRMRSLEIQPPELLVNINRLAPVRFKPPRLHEEPTPRQRRTRVKRLEPLRIRTRMSWLDALIHSATSPGEPILYAPPTRTGWCVFPISIEQQSSLIYRYGRGVQCENCDGTGWTGKVKSKDVPEWYTGNRRVINKWSAPRLVCGLPPYHTGNGLWKSCAKCRPNIEYYQEEVA